ncbi:pseudouridine synthase [Marinobacter halodurans]|uniref:Pseudouridine synthase n=1 Tax=Marinobacter halodurans TaxID=2528979 RepID=A0ABY1ZSJ6_9GAMM|nr:pseudouridine synthase [Marinobacter halodurans]TBW58795.1 pseudouridine synthase [Marinobacter halodurans]
MRLDFLIANGTGLSRKDARRALMASRVTLDGVVCRKAATQLSGEEDVRLDGEPVALTGERYLMLHKPLDVVSATRDSEHTTVLDLLPPDLRRNLHVAGRLDRDTTGLLLLTTDGQWSHRVTSPRSRCNKTYRVDLAEAWTEDMLASLRNGVTLKGEPKPTAPAQVEVLGDRQLRLIISEGRYHQVKRMLAAVGNHVDALHREAIGAVRLDPVLAPGDYRALTRKEIDSFG